MLQKKTSTAPSASNAYEPRVLNSLLRCIRSDDKASEQFEKVEKIPGLWVLELGPETSSLKWSEWLTRTHLLLSQNQKFLSSLSHGSSDYTLHVSVSLSESQRIVMPPAFSQIAAAIGVIIEIYRLED